MALFTCTSIQFDVKSTVQYICMSIHAVDTHAILCEIYMCLEKSPWDLRYCKVFDGFYSEICLKQCEAWHFL
jgi:hypothetical protein